MNVEGIDDDRPLSFDEFNELRHAAEAWKKIRKRTEELALPVIQELASGQIDREEAFKQLKQILLDNFSSTKPIGEGLPPGITTSRMEEFLGNLALLLHKNGVSREDVNFFLKIGSDPEDTRDKVEKVVDPDPESSD